MSDISELEQRMTAALDRIRRSVEMPRAPVAADAAPVDVDTDAVDALASQLDEEKTANAQLEERVKALKERQDGNITKLQGRLDRHRSKGEVLDRDLQRLRQTNAELRDINAQLRAALEAGVSEPHLINKAMMAELDALRANRAADASEVDAVLAQLTPMLSGEDDETDDLLRETRDDEPNDESRDDAKGDS